MPYHNKIKVTEEQRALLLGLAIDQDAEQSLMADRKHNKKKGDIKPTHVEVRTLDEERTMYKDGSEARKLKVEEAKKAATGKSTTKVKEKHTEDAWDKRTKKEIPKMMEAELSVDREHFKVVIYDTKMKNGGGKGMGSMDLGKADKVSKARFQKKTFVEKVLAHKEQGSEIGGRGIGIGTGANGVKEDLSRKGR